MSEDMGTERPQEERDRPEIVHPDPLAGDDESSYGGAGQSEAGEEDQDGEQSGPNRPPSEQDEDQGI